MQPRKSDPGPETGKGPPGSFAFGQELDFLSLSARSDSAGEDIDSWRGLNVGQQRARERWLVRMRWIAIAGVIVVVGVAGALGWVKETVPLFAIVAFMASYNLASWYFSQESHIGRGERQGNNTIILQILADLASLTMLLYWSGGITNPFALFFSFHMAIGATLLTTRQACAMGTAGSLFWGGTVLAEHWGWIPHNHIYVGERETARIIEVVGSDLQVGGYLTAFVLMLFGIIYFVRTVERDRWAAEIAAFRQHQRAASQDRMARIGEITAGVAHTVRNPLQGVLSCLDLLRDGNVGHDEKAVELMDMADGGLQRIERVTRRLLTLTRERKLNKTLTDLGGLIQDSISLLQQKATTRGVELELRMAELPPVWLDPDAISEVIMNLVDNAIFACGQGDKILIETSTVGDKNEVVGICVCDSGSGIPDDELDRVFNPFFTTKTVGEGAGLGLAIVKEIITIHAGTVRALSRTGGSCFRLLLPVNSANEQGQGVKPEHEQAFRSCCR